MNGENVKSTRDAGDHGEDIACEFLQSYNYSIIARNYYAGHSEIDIIALSPDGETVVFCEVKTRAQRVADKYGRPANAVGYVKQKNLTFAAGEYMRIHKKECGERNVRIDVIEVYVSEGKLPKVHHIRNAVTAHRGY